MSERKPQAAILGWDMGVKGGDRTAYYCRECGPLSEPCTHIDAYFKSQVREREAIRSAQFDHGERRHDIEFKRRNG